MVLHAERCLHFRDRRSECADCYAVCPVEAIAPGKPPSLNTELCETCLACLPACPTGVFTAEDDVVTLLSAAGRLEGGVVELLCPQNRSPETGLDADATGLRIKRCLASLGSGALISLAALGFEQITLRCEDCSTCKWAALQPQIEQQALRAKGFLAAWNKQGVLHTVIELKEPIERTIWNADNPPVSRREMFQVMARRGSTMVARAMENNANGAEKSPGRDRQRVLGAIRHLPAASSPSAASLDGMRFAGAWVTEACTACGACAKACPTGALAFSKAEDGQSYTLKFTAGKCIDCGFCTRVCLPKAIQKGTTDLSSVFTNETILLREGKIVKCSRCAAPMAERPGTTLCPVCEVRSRNPVASMLPTPPLGTKPQASQGQQQ